MPDLWQDQLNYNGMVDGPPYLPGVPTPRVASLRVPEGERRKLWAFVHRKAAEPQVEAKVVFSHLLSEFAGMKMPALGILLAALRAEAMVHQANHWQTRGPHFYADHELFQRLYQGADALVDKMAERAAGLGETALVGVLLQQRVIGIFLESFTGPFQADKEPNRPALSFRATLRFLVLLDMAYDMLKQQGHLTPGLDTLLQDIADKHEEFAYLLKQRMADVPV